VKFKKSIAAFAALTMLSNAHHLRVNAEIIHCRNFMVMKGQTISLFYCDEKSRLKKLVCTQDSPLEITFNTNSKEVIFTKKTPEGKPIEEKVRLNSYFCCPFFGVSKLTAEVPPLLSAYLIDSKDQKLLRQSATYKSVEALLDGCDVSGSDDDDGVVVCKDMVLGDALMVSDVDVEKKEMVAKFFQELIDSSVA
jgi:hypothetical protein